MCELTFNAVERDEIGKNIPDQVLFTTDSWRTIQKAVQTGNTNLYNVGDVKEVDLGDLGTHTVRISNMSACTTETSETACGFVIEFVDIITEQPFNSVSLNVGGWKDSKLRTYVNGKIYNSLPNDLQNVISSTKVISGHGSTSGETNFETQDKLYLLSSEEIYGDFSSSSNAQKDTAVGTSKQLDYYKEQEVTVENVSAVRKSYSGNPSGFYWWLRSARSDIGHAFLIVLNGGWWSQSAFETSGISPAFRIA